MEALHYSKNTVAFGLAYSIVSLVSAMLVIIKETQKETVFEWMRMISGHHWATHSLMTIVLFFIVGWMMLQFKYTQQWETSSSVLTCIVVGSTLLSGFMIAAFFLLH